MKNKDLALKVAGTIFALGAVMHLVRLLRQVPMVVNGVDFPLRGSVIGVLIAGSLAFWMFYNARDNGED